MKKIILFLAVVFAVPFLMPGINGCLAQNVGINSTGATPDTSAMLDIVSTSKGMLIPRVALTATNSASPVTIPATSLLVYNTATAGTSPNNVTPGFYYWNGTQWVRILNNGNASGADWSLTGNSGTTASTSGIGTAVNNNFIGTTDGTDFVFASNNLERMRITSGGNVGIGLTGPNYQLQIGSSTSGNGTLGIGSTINYSGTGQIQSINNNPTFNLTSASSPVTSVIGTISIPEITSSANNPNLNFAYGHITRVDINAGYTGTVTTGIGYNVQSPVLGSGVNPFSNYYEFYGNSIANGNGITSGTINNAGLFISPHSAASAGGIVNNYAANLFVSNAGASAGTTNNYAIYIQGNGGTASGTGIVNNWSIYDPSTAPTYFFGKVGMGTTSAAEQLHVVGNIRNSALAGGGTIVVEANNNGNLIPLAAGTSSQVLLGTGAWGNVPGGENDWSLTGNSGTVDGTNFIGSTDSVAFTVRVNNYQSGRIDPGLFNSYWGYKAGVSNTTGVSNTAAGYLALDSNATGSHNTAIGQQALYRNTVSNNTGIGYQALENNTTATGNTAAGYQSLYNNNAVGNSAFGQQSLYSNTTGTNNCAFGINALKSNISAINNNAFGAYALTAQTTGSFNVALGTQALYTDTSGGSNVAVGNSALFYNTNGDYNTAVGNQALLSNTTGIQGTAVGFNSLYSNTTGSDNSAYGEGSLYLNTTGSDNTAIGVASMDSATTASYNTAVGMSTLFYNKTGSNNTAEGYGALYKNISSNNTAVGYEALIASTSASNNTAIGFEAMFSDTSGTNDVAVGYQALYSNVTPNGNTAIGVLSMFNNTFGTNNTAVGIQSLDSNTTGGDNTALGRQAMFRNTTASNDVGVGFEALYNNTTGSTNTATGYQALYSNSTTTGNVADGFQSLYLNTGTNNTSVGTVALYFNTTGINNTAIGAVALDSNTTGSYNTALGYQTEIYPAANNINNATAIGYGAVSNASNKMVMGNSVVTVFGYYGTLTALSDGRFKRDVQENVAGLDFINQLRPVTYHLDMHKLDKFIYGSQSDEYEKNMAAGVAAKEKILYSGFIAQEVEKAAKATGYDFSGVVPPQNDKDHYGLDYGQFVVPLVKSVQELSAKNDSLEKDIQKQQELIQTLLSEKTTSDSQIKNMEYDLKSLKALVEGLPAEVLPAKEPLVSK